MSGAPQLRVRVHYDFASTLCYVAHRSLARIAGEIAGLGIERVWSPLDLARLVGPHRAGAPIDELRRSNAARVAEELGVPVRVAPRARVRARPRAREEQVSGVPTFMLGAWPFGGIQSDATMLHVLERFAKKSRAGA